MGCLTPITFAIRDGRHFGQRMELLRDADTPDAP